MKKLLFFALVSSLLLVQNSVACQEECRYVCNRTSLSSVEVALIHAGKALEKVQVPQVGKLTNMLPFAVVSFCLQNFPIQTLVLMSSATAYCMYNTTIIHRCVDYCRSCMFFKDTSKQQLVQLEDTFFVFDGETLEDAEEEEDLEDELLDISDEDDDDDYFKKDHNQS